MYKLVATDMDETFLDHGHQIPEANIRAMQRMKELGVLFVPSSGRWYSSIMDNFAHLDPALLEGSYVISYNGGFINRVGDPNPLTSCGIGRACAEELYALGRELGKCMHVNVADGHVFVCDAPEAERTYLEKISGVTHFNSAEHTDLSFLDSRDIVKLIFMDPDFEGLQQLGRELEPMAQRLGVEITFSSKRYLEFMPRRHRQGLRPKEARRDAGYPHGPGDRRGRLRQRPRYDQGRGTGRGRGQRHGRCPPLLRQSYSNPPATTVPSRNWSRNTWSPRPHSSLTDPSRRNRPVTAALGMNERLVSLS